jgi:hypothetical protein
MSQQVKILGVIFRSTLEASIQDSWTAITTAVRVQARLDYARQLCLAHRVKYVVPYLLSRIWYLAQILPPPARHAQQLMTACTWFIWRGAILRVPAMTLQRPTAEGGWTLPHVAVKCTALLLDRMTLTAEKTTVTAALVHLWDLDDAVNNPPNVGLPRTLAHARQYALDMAYIAPTPTNEPRHTFRRRIYETIRLMHSNAARSEEPRIVRLYPQVNWHRLWANLHTADISDEQKSIWFTVFHDIIPTKHRLATIRLADTNRCNSCGDEDTLQHRLTQCGVSKMLWCWTWERIAAIAATTPLDVPEEWVLRPDFSLRPPRSHKAVV